MLSITKRIKLIGKKEFIAATLDPDYKVFVIYIAAFNINFNIGDEIHPLKSAQIAYLKEN